jgi:hypothetical protein
MMGPDLQWLVSAHCANIGAVPLGGLLSGTCIMRIFPDRKMQSCRNQCPMNLVFP